MSLGSSKGRRSGPWAEAAERWLRWLVVALLAQLAAFGSVDLRGAEPGWPGKVAYGRGHILPRCHGNTGGLSGPLSPRNGSPSCNPNPPLTCPDVVHLSYFGGKVISNVRIVMVLYGTGSYATYVTSTVAPSMSTFYQQVVQSSYLDWLCEYSTPNQTIGRGSFAGVYTITPSRSNDRSTIGDANIQSELARQIANGTLPAPDSNTLYMVHFPAGKTIDLGGSFSCVDFCAYHSTGFAGSVEFYYGVLPDNSPGSGCDSGCGGAGSPLGDLCSVASHELIESITDPEVGLAATNGPPLAWYDPCSNSSYPDNGEIGDICNACAASFTGTDGQVYSVQRGWSNLANDCIYSGSVGAPLAGAQSLTNQQGVPVAVFLSGTDTNLCQHSLTYSVTANPAHGALSGTAPTLTYTPAISYAGPDSFQFKVNNGVLDSSPATVSIDLVPMVLSIARLPDRNMLLTVSTAPNGPFTLQATDYLTNPPPWVSLLNSNAGPGGTVSVADTAATNHSQRLYRAAAP